MVMLAAGFAMLAALLFAARSFSRASVATIKALLAWIVALAGLSLACLLLLTGRGPAALSGLVLLGPLIWRWWKEHAGEAGAAGPSRPPPPVRVGPMKRAEALEVLGLSEPVSDSDVRAAWVRLMRVAHPDGGGSDWLAARVNQAKDVLLGRR
ncbi:MAG: hypothetical protein RQ966_06160 [Acetobacteraceae bacterium]|nr:hypothetical protein [Acetobacteraceae bacterium]